ncbi:hypothetical protein AAG570_008723 [Ranatra chinensis]|uniref:Uncharacterized protein n=1 Tax=Ranatra chinensis TaxID=642074 RepID=A0ABD0YRR7_9HEMI
MEPSTSRPSTSVPRVFGPLQHRWGCLPQVYLHWRPNLGDTLDQLKHNSFPSEKEIKIRPQIQMGGKHFSNDEKAKETMERWPLELGKLVHWLKKYFLVSVGGTPEEGVDLNPMKVEIAERRKNIKRLEKKVVKLKEWLRTIIDNDKLTALEDPELYDFNRISRADNIFRVFLKSWLSSRYPQDLSYDIPEAKLPKESKIRPLRCH